jgi:short-subunit dehydrogenase
MKKAIVAGASSGIGRQPAAGGILIQDGSGIFV